MKMYKYFVHLFVLFSLSLISETTLIILGSESSNPNFANMDQIALLIDVFGPTVKTSTYYLMSKLCDKFEQLTDYKSSLVTHIHSDHSASLSDSSTCTCLGDK